MSAGTILIVEDDNDIREVYSLVLRHNGYTVQTAKNGQEGLDSLEKYHPKLVLLDIFMPIMSGELFLQHLREFPTAAEIIVCSNTSDQALMQTMLKLGASRVVTKSDMSPNDLIDLVKPYMDS